MIKKLLIKCEPDFTSVCRVLGEERNNPEESKEIYEQELTKLRQLVHPVALFGTLQGEAHEPLLAVLLTVGRDAEQYTKELFSKGEHLRALIVDGMQSAWLFAMDEQIQGEIKAFCERERFGVKRRMEAPDTMQIEMHWRVCEALHAEQLADVYVTDAYMFDPEKTMCYVLMLSDNCDQFLAGHDCRLCKRTDCQMRTVIDVKNGDADNQNGDKKMIKIVVEDQGKKCVCEAGSCLLDVLRENSVHIDAPCGGSGRCGKCKVRVVGGELPVTAEDRTFLSEREIGTGVRLACMARPISDLRIRVMAKAGKQIAAVSEMSGGRSGINTGQSADSEQRNTARKQMSGNAMESKNARNASVYDDAFENKEVSAFDENGYGIGIDIGTTTLAACLYGWSDGTVYKTVTAVNSGRDFGADVLSRMEASCNGKRARLQELLQEDVCGLLVELLRQATAQAKDIQKIVIAANMTMVHLLMGYSCETLGRAPFVPANKRMICADAMRILGDGSLCCPVIILPAISAFVGGDIVAGMLTLGMDKGNESVLLLDVGTNGEMALRHNGQIYVTSTAAGPAFEGGGISCGCASIPGAICGVKLVDDQMDMSSGLAEGRTGGSNYGTYQEQDLMLRTIGDAAPVGICGSGVLELVSELLRVGLLDETGLFAEQYRESGFPIGKTVSGEMITFTQGDVRALQLAKGAIRAGIEALLAAADVRAEEVSQIYLAGGFGVRMDEKAAIRIGLLPEVFRGRIRPVGNSSLSGAVFAGRCDDIMSACEELLAQCRQVVLAEQPEFEENYLRYMNLSDRRHT